MIVKGEAQKSPQEFFLFEFQHGKKITDFTNTPCKSTCLYNTLGLIIVDVIMSQRSENTFQACMQGLGFPRSQTGARPHFLERGSRDPRTSSSLRPHIGWKREL